MAYLTRAWSVIRGKLTFLAYMCIQPEEISLAYVASAGAILVLFYTLNQTKAGVGSTHVLKLDGRVQDTNQKGIELLFVEHTF